MSEKIFKNQAENRKEEFERKDELSLSHWRGNLHAHSKKDISNPKTPEDIARNREGSNCGQIPLQILTKYLAEEMLNDYVEITEHSRDADPEKALEGILKWFTEMYLQNDEWLLKTYGKKREELSLEDLKNIELMAASQTERVACYQDERLRKINFTIENLDESIKVFKGVEANLLPDGSFDTDMVDQNKFELVNCSIHPKVDKKNFKNIVSDPTLYSKLAIEGIKNPKTNVMCHLGYELEKDVLENLEWDKIFKEALENKVAIEINLKEVLDYLYKNIFDEKKFPKDEKHYLDDFKAVLPSLVPILNDEKAFEALCKYSKKGLKIAINTDEHQNPFIETKVSQEKIVYNFKKRSIRFWRCLKELEEYFNKKFKEAGINGKNIINTYSVTELEKFLRKEI